MRVAALNILIGVAILAATPVFADNLTFERGSLSTALTFAGSNLSGSAAASLPSLAYRLPLTAEQQVEQITFEVVKLSSLGYTSGPEFTALTTADSDRYDSRLLADHLVPTFGRQALEVTGRESSLDGDFAELTVFPITVDENGEIWFNEEIAISVSGSPVDASALQPVDITNESAREVRSSSASSTGDDFLIVTSTGLADAFQPWANYRTKTGYRVRVALIEDILATESGRDNAERLRSYIQTFHAAGGRYVLLGGDETVLPIRHAYHYSASSAPDLSEQQVCDLYFADVTGDWDADNDGIWGERYYDNPDVVPELRLGRILVNTADQVSVALDNLIRYETDPGVGDFDYLTRAFFFSSDQMRDDGSGGQHAAIAEAYPSWIAVDTLQGVEVSRGDDPAPFNLPGNELGTVLQNGFGIVNIIAHGRSDGFVVRSADYNQWPKSYLFSAEQGGDHGTFASLLDAERPAFYYSLACDNGGFDMDQPPFDITTPNVVQNLMDQPGGAVGFVAYSRWGWISSSHLLQRSFFQSLFDHPELPAVEAMYASKTDYYYYRDLVYGQNYFGDPAVRVYTETPRRLTIDASTVDGRLVVTVSSEGASVSNCAVVVSTGDELLGQFSTDSHGQITAALELDTTVSYHIAALMPGATTSLISYSPGSVTSVDDDPTNGLLPRTLTLHQNYPNPFNPTTAIAFELPTSAHVRLEVFNLLGQTVATLVDETMSAGQHSTEWNGCDDRTREAASGIYFYRLSTGEASLVKKMVLVR